ncbi:MAG: glycosyltransferase family 39 protein, partial [Chloroflexota bacterium]
MMSQKQSLKKMTVWLLPVLILLFGFMMRVADGAGTTTFRYDQARLAQISLEMANGELFPLLGIQSSAGVPNSPMTVYVLAPFFALSSNPVVIALFIILLNIIGLAVLWRIAHQYFGIGVATIAILVYAVSPYAIEYSRRIWAQNYHTPFILLGIWCGLEGFVQKKTWAQIACLPLLIIGFQIHFAAWTLLPIYLCLLWLGRKNIRWGAVITSVILAIGVTIPFVLGILGQPAGASDRASMIANIISGGIDYRLNYVLSLVSDLVSGVGRNGQLADTAFSLFVSDAVWGAFVVFAL